MLVLNAAFIGVQVEAGFQDEEYPAITAIDVSFCVLFSIELILRMYAHGVVDFFTDPAERLWNSFDSFVVGISTGDLIISTATSGESTFLSNISLLRVTRVVRLIRVVRMIRVMKFFQDFRILLAAIISTIKTASFALALITFLMYMFGVAIAQLTSEHMIRLQREGDVSDPELRLYFGSVGASMLSLFMTITGGIDWKDAYFPLSQVSAAACLVFLIYISLMTLCIMNVLFGIFCQCALDAASLDREQVVSLQMAERKRFVEELTGLFARWDYQDSGNCTLAEFKHHLEDEETQALLSSLQIPARDAVMLFELLDADGSGTVDLDEFVTGCITLRGEAKAVHMEKLGGLSRGIEMHFEKLETGISEDFKKLEANFWYQCSKLDSVMTRLDSLLPQKSLANTKFQQNNPDSLRLI